MAGQWHTKHFKGIFCIRKKRLNSINIIDYNYTNNNKAFLDHVLKCSIKSTTFKKDQLTT